MSDQTYEAQIDDEYRALLDTFWQGTGYLEEKRAVRRLKRVKALLELAQAREGVTA